MATYEESAAQWLKRYQETDCDAQAHKDHVVQQLYEIAHARGWRIEALQNLIIKALAASEEERKDILTKKVLEILSDLSARVEGLQ